MTPRTNADWVAALTAGGVEQATALTELRAYLLRAAVFTLNRSRHRLEHLGPAAVDQLAEDCAQEALLAILQHLGTFRGDSRFTTWAFAFAVNMALVAARRERWKRVPLDGLLDGSLPLPAPVEADSPSADPQRQALRANCPARSASTSCRSTSLSRSPARPPPPGCRASSNTCTSAPSAARSTRCCASSPASSRKKLPPASNEGCEGRAAHAHILEVEP